MNENFEQPLVSILMTAFNREQYISEAIESVLNSTYKNFELLIVDDRSSDKTVEIAKKYLEDDLRIKLFVNEVNLGDYANRNKAATLAKGKYLMYVDSDDKSYADSISYCVTLMEQYPHAKIGMYCPLVREPIEIAGRNAIQKHFFEKPFLMIGPGGTILEREFFLKIGKYPTLYGPANDMYFNLYAASLTSILLLPYEFVFYRRHAGQEINNTYSYLINNYRYLRDILNENKLPIRCDQKHFLLKKNDRRFFVNILKFYFKTKSLTKTMEVSNKAGYKFPNLIKGIFHFN